jgi:hypothetical protein
VTYPERQEASDLGALITAIGRSSWFTAGPVEFPDRDALALLLSVPQFSRSRMEICGDGHLGIQGSLELTKFCPQEGAREGARCGLVS